MKLVLSVKHLKTLKEQYEITEDNREKAIEIIEDYEVFLSKKKKGKSHDTILRDKLIDFSTDEIEYEGEMLTEVKGKTMFKYKDIIVKIYFSGIYDKEYNLTLDEASSFTIEFDDEIFTNKELNIDAGHLIDRIYEFATVKV